MEAVLIPTGAEDLIRSHPKAVDIIAIVLATGESLKEAIEVAKDAFIIERSRENFARLGPAGGIIFSVLNNAGWAVVPMLEKEFGPDAVSHFIEARRQLQQA